MNSELLWSWLKIIAALPIVLLLAYISFKLSRNYMSSFKRGMYMRVIETIPIYNKSAVSIIQIGGKYFVVGVSEQSFQVLTELTKEEINEIKEQDQYRNSNTLSKLMTQLRDSKDWRQK